MNFNKNGFAEVQLPASLARLNNKRLKLSAYCPAKNENSSSENKETFISLNISEPAGKDRWNNMNFNLSDLQLLEAVLPALRGALVECLEGESKNV